MSPESTAEGSIVIEDVVCPYCADLCDDLRLTVERNRIAAVEVECPAGRAFFSPLPTDAAVLGRLLLRLLAPRR